MNPYAFGGFLVGVLVGTVFVGALFGWICHKVFRLPYPAADILGLILLVGGATFANSGEERTPIEAFLIYGITATLAFFIIQQIRMRQPGGLSANGITRSEPRLSRQQSDPETILEQGIAEAIAPGSSDARPRPDQAQVATASVAIAKGARTAVRWRRGMFRLWVVLSGLWVIVVGVISFGPIMNPYRYVPSEGFLFRDFTNQFQRFSEYSPEYRATVEQKNAGKYDWWSVEVDGLDGAVVFIPAGASTRQRDEKLNIIVALVKAELDKRTVSARWQGVSIFVGAGLIPPLVLLAVGAAVGWALSGFRSQGEA